MLLPRIDFTALFPQRAANYVEQHGGKVYTSCGVEASTGYGFEDRHRNYHHRVRGDGQRYSATSSVPTSPAIAATHYLRARIAESSTTRNRRTDRSLQHQPIYTVYLQYPAHVRLPHPMLGLHQRYSQWLFDKGQIAAQHGLIAAVISAEGIHQELSQEELAQKVIAELREEFGIAEQPQWFKVIAEKRATFCCSPNLQRPAQQTPLPRLLLAGDYTAGDYPATLEGAVMSGVEMRRDDCRVGRNASRFRRMFSELRRNAPQGGFRPT